MFTICSFLLFTVIIIAESAFMGSWELDICWTGAPDILSILRDGAIAGELARGRDIV